MARSSRHKMPVTASGLRRAFAGRGGGFLPWRYVLHFEDAGGIAAAMGREAVVTLTPGELADAVGAIPASLLDDEDMRAVLRVCDLLRTQHAEGRA